MKPSEELARQLDLPSDERSFRVNTPELDDGDLKEVLAKIKGSIKANERNVVPFWRTKLGIAASIASVLFISSVIFLAMMSSVQRFQTFQGGITEIQLNGDRSNNFTINAVSKATLTKFVAFKGREQYISLEGEAFFMLKEHAVKIQIGAATASSDNGYFNIYNREGHLIIASVSAFVNVAFKGLTRTVGPGQMLDFFEYATSIPETISIASTQIGSWVRGEFSFIDQRLSFALAEFTRQFGVQLQLPEGFDPLISARFNKKDGWEASLEALSSAASATIEHTGDTISISPRI
ncbi:MAG: hypothetical protein IM613_11015 [Cytophagales bacterium]|nr:hypothetical protein [Cytophagales bacterium]